VEIGLEIKPKPNGITDDAWARKLFPYPMPHVPSGSFSSTKTSTTACPTLLNNIYVCSFCKITYNNSSLVFIKN
jgi:hypothetical protein